MKKIFTSTWLAAAGLLLGASAVQAQTVYGLLSPSGAAQRLITFDAKTPGTFSANRAITGLAASQTLVGLDSRPSTGQLYALGYFPLGSQAQLYTLNPATGALTTVGAPLTLALGSSTSRIGFDFNPTVDRIRITGGNNTNFRVNPTNGALAATDGRLAYASTDPNAGQTPGIGSVAYANSYIGATTTVLYDIDEANSRYTRQDPPNDGVLLSRAQLTVNTAMAVATDLDVYFDPATRTNTAYLSIVTGTPAAPTTQLYTLDFILGTNMTAVGQIGPNGSLVTDIAFAINRPATLPAVTGQLVYALAGTNLLTFDTARPNLIRTQTGITGIPADQTLVGIDVRPANNVLYGLGYRLSDQKAQLYSFNATTGAATAVGTPVALALGTAATDAIGFDFNPTVDRIRVVSTNRANYRLNPNDGTIAATDTPLSYTAGDANAAATPAVATAAYTNSFRGATATSGTTLYDYDRALNILTTQAPPNDGKLNTVGSSGLTLNATTPIVSLDIYSTAVGTNTAYLLANSATSAASTLYTVNLATGATTFVGLVGFGSAVRDLAVAVATGVVTGVKDRADLAEGVNLYPNPTRDNATVAFALPRAARVEMAVVDVLGRRVLAPVSAQLSAGAQSLRLDTGALKAGLYLVRLTVDGQPAAARQLVVE